MSPAISGMRSASVTLEGTWSGQLPAKMFAPKLPMKFRWEPVGAEPVTGEFTHRRTLKHRGVMRLYGKDSAGHRVTADVRVPV